MATGYTTKLHDGEQSVREFILTCARSPRSSPTSASTRKPRVMPGIELGMMEMLIGGLRTPGQMRDFINGCN